MRHADSIQLETVIADAIKRSRLASHFRRLILETGHYIDDVEIIKARIQLSELEKINEGEVDELTSSIERAVDKVDDRFPSVRYASD